MCNLSVELKLNCRCACVCVCACINLYKVEFEWVWDLQNETRQFNSNWLIKQPACSSVFYFNGFKTSFLDWFRYKWIDTTHIARRQTIVINDFCSTEKRLIWLLSISFRKMMAKKAKIIKFCFNFHSFIIFFDRQKPRSKHKCNHKLTGVNELINLEVDSLPSPFLYIVRMHTMDVIHFTAIRCPKMAKVSLKSMTQHSIFGIQSCQLQT